MIEPSFINLLKKNNEKYQLLEVELSDEFESREIITTTWGNGRIDIFAMNKKTIEIFDTSSDDSLSDGQVIIDILNKNIIIGELIVVWSNALLYALKLDIMLVKKYIEEIVSEDFDCWIYQEHQNWVIEKYHEGEIVYITD